MWVYSQDSALAFLLLYIFMYIYFERIFISVDTYEILTEYLKLYVDITSGSSYVLPNYFLCISLLRNLLLLLQYWL